MGHLKFSFLVNAKMAHLRKSLLQEANIDTKFHFGTIFLSCPKISIMIEACHKWKFGHIYLTLYNKINTTTWSQLSHLLHHFFGDTTTQFAD